MNFNKTRAKRILCEFRRTLSMTRRIDFFRNFTKFYITSILKTHKIMVVKI